MLHPTGGEGTETRLLEGAMFGDGRAKKLLVCRDDTAFAVWALGVISRGEDSSLAVKGGKLGGKMLANFLYEAAEQAPHIASI